MGFWKWKVRFYYADHVQAPKRPGELAIETVHADAVSLGMELAAGNSRDDIGRIEVLDLDPPPRLVRFCP
jgi:hypothetical protein